MAGNLTTAEKNIKDIIKEYNCEDSIVFLGRTNEVKKYMSKATAFMMTSLNEGLGRTTVEAMFYGCPVVARNSGGTVEFVRNNENGLLFNNIEECVADMKRTASEDMSEISHNAQTFAAEHFSEENYGNKIYQIYNTTINNE